MLSLHNASGLAWKCPTHVYFMRWRILCFDCSVKQNDNGTVTVAYTFGSAYANVIKGIAVSGTNYKYIRSSLLFVQDQTITQPPPFMFDTMVGKPGFVDPAGSDVTVTLTTKVRSTDAYCSFLLSTVSLLTEKFAQEKKYI